MDKRKCPAWGSSNVVDIIYGYPSTELFEASERGEVILGGCCVNIGDNTYSCKDCGQNFGGEITASGELRGNIKSFFFYIGGFHGTSHYAYMSDDGSDRVMRYIRSEGFVDIDIKNKIPKECFYYEGVYIKEEEWPSKMWQLFKEELLKFNVDYWANSYTDPNILDGTQWEIVVEYNDNEKIVKNGCNAYPPDWKRFIGVMRKYVDDSIL